MKPNRTFRWWSETEPDRCAGGVVEGSGEEDVLGQRLELDQLQGKETLESKYILAFNKKFWGANIIG